MAALTAKAADSWFLLQYQHIHQCLISILISKGHFVQSSINKVVSEWVTDFGRWWSDLGLIKSIIKRCLFLIPIRSLPCFVNFICKFLLFQFVDFVEFMQPLQKSRNLFFKLFHYKELTEFDEVDACSAVEAIKTFCQYYEAKLCSNFLWINHPDC